MDQGDIITSPLRKKVSRRRLLQGAAVGAIGLGIVSVAGCDDDEENNGSQPQATASTTARSYPDQGISDAEIKIGNTIGYSGPVVAGPTLGAGAKAYFAYINDQGGVSGRKINFISYDDAYNPSQTVEQTRRLVEQDKVFFLFAGLGTAHQAAITPYLNQRGVPRLMMETAASQFANPKTSPLDTIGIPSYYGKGALLGRYVAKEMSSAKIGMLLQNDDLGKEWGDGFEFGLGDKKSQIVSKQTYEPTDSTLDSQIVALKDSGANVFLDTGVGKFTVLSLKSAFSLGWRPTILLGIPGTRVALSTVAPAGLDTVDGAISLMSDKDPTDPQWKDDAAIIKAQGIVDKYQPGLKLDDAGLGYVTAIVLTEILRQMKEPTKAGLVQAAHGIKGVDADGLMLPGVTWAGSPDSNFLIRKAKYARFQGGRWVPFGDLLDIPERSV